MNQGLNALSVTVTAPDNTTVKTYNVSIKRLKGASGNANLAGLGLSAGTLSPAFNENITGYNVDLPMGTSAISVTPTVAGVNAVVEVNGEEVASGESSQSIPLATGITVIHISVYAGDEKTEKNYVIAVNNVDSAGNASLADLSISAGTLSPVFDPDKTAYDALVPYITNSITVTPTVAVSDSVVKVNGTVVSSGSASGNIDLTVGANLITVIVTSENNNNRSYKLRVNRVAANDNADLAGLSLSAGTLSPLFSVNTTGYNVSVPFSTSEISVTPVVAYATSIVTVNDVIVTSGTASEAIELDEGSNTIEVQVFSESGIPKTYTIVITRLPVNTNANLAGLSVSAGTLTPSFSVNTTSYTVDVPYTATGISLRPTVSASTSTVKVNGTAIASGTYSGTISLSVGSNPVTVLVAAESGAEKAYTVIVKRTAASTNANLANLTLSSGWLSPALNLDTTSYTAEVAYAIPSITVTATVSGLNASLTIKGTPVTSGAASDSIALSPGNNRIDVVVTAEDGTTTKTYTVTVNRIAASTNANLAGLSLSSGTLSPGFAADTTSYSTEIPYSISSITVTPVVAGLNAKVKVNGTTVVSGTASSSLNMSIGDNTISVAVTAESGATKTYTISVNRLNIYGYLSSLTVSQGVLPFFNKDVTSYSMDVPDSVTAITVTPVASSSVHSLIEVNGSPVASGAPSGLIDLSMGSNTITIIVTGDDGTHSTYSLLINRIGLSDLLNFKISCGWNYTMIIRNDGSLWGTGYNYYGQFGNGTNVWYMTTSIRNMDNVASVSAGGFHTMIIKTDGSLWATGRNDYGQLGDGTISDRSTPVHIMDSVAFVSAFDNQTIIIKKEGSLWETGNN